MKLAIAFLLACGLAGCASAAGSAEVYQSEVSSYASSQFAAGRSYAIAPSEAQKNDLAFDEAATWVARSLQRAGFEVGGNLAAADVAVTIDFGISGPNVQTAVESAPIYGQVGTERWGPEPIATSPRFGVVGTRTYSSSITTYDRHLTLTGYDARSYQANHDIRPLWRVDVRSTGSDDDLRTVLPAMISAATPYIGTSSGKQVTVRVRSNDPGVLDLIGGVPASPSAPSAR